MPGATQFTLMLWGARSEAAALVKPSKAVLLTEYAPRSCNFDATFNKYFIIKSSHKMLIIDLFESSN